MERRKSYTAAFKLDAVNYRDLHGTLAAASHFEVTEAMIRKWVVDRQNLQEMPATKRARRYKKPSVEEVEDAIYNWVVKKREENRAVTVKEIRTKAKELAEEHCHQNFKASAHWCILFMARKKLSVRRRTSVVEVWNKRENHNSDPDRSLLIFDSARCHVTDEVKQFCQQYGKIAVIPGGLTKILQPLDVGINKPFKDHLKAGWEKWMRDEAKATYTKSGIRRRMSYEEAAFLVSESFQSISSDVIQHSFEKALCDLENLKNDFAMMNINDDDEVEIGKV
ncbi:hypothetical protein RB195_024182 [Necator americanus]|uniref:HTH CENPB-type domain-containing protein n=1 Tax=Necator americanus TaxID=51031 RepID=A0ABR1EMC6_NECAM